MFEALRVTGDRVQDQLAYPPRGLRLSRAAAYLGMSERTFRDLVAEGRLPKPKRLRGLHIWDRLELDAAFESLESQPAKRRNSFDAILGMDDESDDSDSN